MATYIHTPGHQAASRGHTVLRMLGQSRRLQCPSLGVLSPLKDGRRGREGEKERGRKGEREREGDRERGREGRNKGSRRRERMDRMRERER